MRRVNGFDCVDDTNIAQYIISQYVLQMMFRDTGKSGGTSSKLDRQGLKRYMYLWHQNGNALSVIYTGTFSMNRSTAPFLTRNLLGWSLALKIARNYLNCFQDQRKQEDLNIVMGHFSEKQSRSGVITSLSPQVSDAVKETQKLRIQFRKNVVQKEFSQAVFISTTFFVRAFLSPSEVNSVLQFIAALFWLTIHWIMLRFGIDRNVLIRRTRSTTRLDECS